MYGNGFGKTGDFEAMARQYWSSWGESLRQGGIGAAPAPSATANFQQAVEWWSQLMPGGPSQANDAVARFNQQASHWFGQMQQVAAQFAGQDSSAADVSQAWRRALGANGDNPFPDLFKAMRGQGAHGLDEWLEQAKPYLDGLQQQNQRWQQLPAFGQYREHQERWQKLQLAQQDYQQRTEAFDALMLKCAQSAFETFENHLTAHEQPGRQITSARALFDLWIDSAEQAYSEIALSQEYRERCGALTNAQMRLRAAIQDEVERIAGLFGMPGRTEIDSAHRKVAGLERALRRAAAAQPVAKGNAAGVRAAPEPALASASKKSARRAVRKPPARKPVGKPASRPASKQAAPRNKPAARKRAAKPATVQHKKTPQKSVQPEATKADFKQTAPKKPATPGKKAAAAKAAPGQSGNSRVVSMKDWVARYAAANATDATPPQKTAGKHKARK